MSQRELELGAVYLLDGDDRPLRVLAFDSAVVMYDSWRPDKSAWSLANISSGFSYLRLPAQFLMERGTYVRTEAYTETELKTHRPDLPMALGQFAAIHWSSQAPKTIARLSAQLARIQDAQAASKLPQLLAVPEVYIAPFGPKGSVKGAGLVKARDGKAFAVAELLWHAWQLQAPHLRDTRVTDGVGLYRSGVQKRTPSYYIWGAMSRMDEAIKNAL